MALRRMVLAVVGVVAAFGPSGARAEDAKVEVTLETAPFAQIYQGADFRTLVPSPDARRIAYVIVKDGKRHVVVNEEVGPAFDKILPGTLSFGPGGSRVAYVGERAGKRHVVADGKEWPERTMDPTGRLGFSPDGSRVTFLWAAPDLSSMWLEVDGVLSPPSKGLFAPVFSRDGRRLAYQLAGADKRARYVVDGVEGKDYAGAWDFAFSPDGKHWAHFAREGEKLWLVRDEGEPTALDGTRAEKLVFDADGNVLAYALQRAGKWTLVIAGKEGEWYETTNGLTASPDGRHVACAVQKGTKFHVVLDGKAGEPYDGIDAFKLRFSADGKRLAYWAGKAGKGHYVVDGVPSAPVDRGGMDGFAFSPDGKRTAWSGQRGGKWFVAVDGVEGPTHDGVAAKTPLFGPDGAHVAYVTWRGNDWFVVVDGVETPLPGPPLVSGLLFDTPGAFRALVVTKEAILSLKGAIASK